MRSVRQLFFKFSACYGRTNTRLDNPGISRESMNNEEILLEMDEARKFIIEGKFQKVIELVDHLKKKSIDFKGAPLFNELLNMQGFSFYKTRKFKEAEMNFINVLEYTKTSDYQYSKKDVFKANKNLLVLYSLSNPIKGKMIMDQIFAKDYESMNEDQKSDMNVLAGIFHFLSGSKEDLVKAIKFYSDSINQNPENYLSSIYAIHNIGLAHLYLLDKKDEVKILEEQVKKNIKLRETGLLEKKFSEVQKNITRRNVSSEIFPDVVFSWMYSLSMTQYLTSPMSIDEIIDNRRYHESSAIILLNLSELLISLKNNKFKELGKNILNLAHLITQNSQTPTNSYAYILYAAYFIDRGEKEQAKTLLNSVLETELEPIEDFNKVMACNMLMYLTNNEKEIRNFKEQLRDIKVKYNITDHSEKLIKLMIPSWEFEMEEDVVNKSSGYFKEDI